MTYPLGQSISLAVVNSTTLLPTLQSVTNSLDQELKYDGELADPALLVLKVRSADGLKVGTYPADPADDYVITRDALGSYYSIIEPDIPGRWYWRWEADVGSGTGKVVEGEFHVKQSSVI